MKANDSAVTQVAASCERSHTVRQGEYLPKIGKTYGFMNLAAIWDHPRNAELKASRKENFNILYPGDRIYIPERLLRTENRPTDQRHTFVLRGKPLNLRVVLKTCDDEARTDLSCVLSVDGDSGHLTTNNEGLLERSIPPSASRAVLMFQDANTQEKTEIAVLIGNLDPIDEVSGQIGRLNNLGYLAGDPEKPDPELLQCAVEEFQCDHELCVDGVCGPETQAKLKEVHGC